MKFSELCCKISKNKATKLVYDHGNGRVIYCIKQPTIKQKEILTEGSFPFKRWSRCAEWEIKDAFDITNDINDKRLFLIKTGR